MDSNAKPVYKTFHLYGNHKRWQVAIAAALLFLAGWFGWSGVSRALALRNIPAFDTIDQDGVILQDTSYTCAPAALAMFFHDAGVNTSQREIAIIAGTDLSGTSDRGIRKAAEYFGYTLTIKKMDFQEIYNYAQPLILEERHGGILHVSYIRKSDYPYAKALEILDPIDGYLSPVFDSVFYIYYTRPGLKKKCFLIERGK